MSTFHLDIMTPEHLFFSGKVQALTVSTTDGGMTILRDHAPICAPLVVGSIYIKQDGEWREAFQSEGFLVVDEQGTHVFVQACEWPENIDAIRAEQARQRAAERLRQKQSNFEYQWTRVAMARAVARLRITRMDINHK